MLFLSSNPLSALNHFHMLLNVCLHTNKYWHFKKKINFICFKMWFQTSQSPKCFAAIFSSLPLKVCPIVFVQVPGDQSYLVIFISCIFLITYHCSVWQICSLLVVCIWVYLILIYCIHIICVGSSRNVVY